MEWKGRGVQALSVMFISRGCFFLFFLSFFLSLEGRKHGMAGLEALSLYLCTFLFLFVFFQGKSSSRTLIRSLTSVTDGLGLFVLLHATIFFFLHSIFLYWFSLIGQTRLRYQHKYMFGRESVDWCHSSLISSRHEEGQFDWQTSWPVPSLILWTHLWSILAPAMISGLDQCF